MSVFWDLEGYLSKLETTNFLSISVAITIHASINISPYLIPIPHIPNPLKFQSLPNLDTLFRRLSKLDTSSYLITKSPPISTPTITKSLPPKTAHSKTKQYIQCPIFRHNKKTVHFTLFSHTFILNLHSYINSKPLYLYIDTTTPHIYNPLK